ncbi:ketopantoate hydroxymethyltransferase [Cytobacillus purgationiresistens]|uniref:Ketopantoate hydroxymethyltransferase n=1 Tax=Cytobacillus purgationiresistens TaxID=863449 RepID=A0ABU0AF87_9BACI|nr:ketopantoate hydroxymethyltransferase [Cytobacillus purgationiresistens]MDQ0269926.1 hypothetical protein [Cytobacillus purgationiresistens]
MISASFKNDIAKYTDQRVSKVVLNGTFSISNFEVKSVSDNVMVLNYIVFASDISLITKIELVDSQNKIISSNDVNIPVTTDQLMIQTIEIKEG